MNNILDILTHVTGLGKGGGVHNGKGHIENLGAGHREVARLVEERLQRQMAFETAFRTSNLLGTTTIGGPASSIHEALLHYDPEGLPEPEATPLIEGETT